MKEKIYLSYKYHNMFHKMNKEVKIKYKIKVIYKRNVIMILDLINLKEL
jgi:hypothetical protein